ncbi:MAG: CDP-diacylglycerol--serine O-phosphatidyltransferase [Gemmatimonadaceae bacterium]|jgi:CDP-diacylglycerol--serine O-phosphatidyltransferase|nr:CDP-diacylglycerol--serine O-phosphatidyltransferase [Gemmatimonadaceae bacterium]
MPEPMEGSERPRRRAVVVLPNGLTLANLFFGIFAIVSAARGDFDAAARYIVFGAVADTLDGRIARATNSGSRFGSELDSLVDAISFGLAPSLIMYFAVLNATGWDWIFCFLFTAAAVIRLARFNVEQAGRAKTHFTGLPSPAAGMTLATYWWFSQTSLYTDTMIGGLPWHQMLRWVMLGLGMLMISQVQYAAVPTVGFRSWRGILGTLLVVGTLIGVIFLPKQFFFPALMAYVLYGIGRTVLLGLLDRLPSPDDDDDLALVADGVAVSGDLPSRRRRRRRSETSAVPRRDLDSKDPS